MPDIDEDVMRELMLRSTADLFAGRGATAEALRRQRQRRVRTRVLGVTGIAAAAGLAVGTLTTGSGAAGPGARPAASSTGSSTGGIKAAQLTDAQRTLYGLSAAAAARPLGPAGRYVVLAEKSVDIAVESGDRETVPKTSVIDTVTGGGVTYQDNTVSGSDPQAPAVLKSPAGTSPTSAQLDAMPTDPAKLRAVLLVQRSSSSPSPTPNSWTRRRAQARRSRAPAARSGRPMTTWSSGRPPSCSGSRT
jgi:hypothetical protein